MDRIREAGRRGNMTAVNGGLTKRRQRGSNLRDSPEGDGAMEMQETGRLRDRGGRKDKDRDRSSRSKRRRGDRMMHGSHREDGEESSEESIDEEEDEEEDDSSVSVRLPLPPFSDPSQSASMMQSHHLRKGYAAKPVRPPGTGTWNVLEEMIGSIPRKARSSAVKRSPECWVSSGGGGPSGSGSCGGVGGEQVHWQTSTSPVRPILSSTTPVSPSSSNASIRKKMKTISVTKHRPPKTSKSSSIQEIEIEVAEVLFGMTRQAPLKKDNHKNNSKESNEVKSRVSSPIAISSPPRTSQSPTVAISNPSFTPSPLTAAPKRKRPRMRFETESPSSTPSSAALPATPISSAVKLDKEAPLPSPAGTKTDPNSPASEKNMSSPAVENGGLSCDPVVPNVCTTTTTLANPMPDLFIPAGNEAPDPKDADIPPEKKTKEEVVSPPKESPSVNLDLDVNLQDHPVTEAASVSDNPRKEKFNIDLMVPAPAKSSLEKESTLYCVADHKPVEMEMEPKLEVSKGQKEKMENKSRTKPEEIAQDCRNTVEPDSKKQAGKDRNLDLQLDLEKQDKDVAGAGKHHAQKQQPRGPRAELRTEKAAESLPLPMQIPGWPASFPPFGYIGQVPLPPFGPVDASVSSSKTVQSLLPSQLRPKRFATHCYIAQNIHYHQQMTRLNPYWPPAVGAAPFYASKQYNLSNTSLSEAAVLGNPMQGSLPCRNLGSAQEKEGPVVSANSGLSTKDKSNAANTSTDSSQKKPPMLQQSSQPGSAGNMLAPAFIFPLNQQQAATVGVCTANRSAVAKLTAGSSNAAQSSSGAGSATMGIPGAYGPGTSMSFNCPGLPLNEAQCLAFLQNNGYPFPIPAHVGGAPPYRGATPAQAMPFFNVSFYPPQMLHPSQLRLPLPQQPPSLQPVPCSQQGHQNISTSSGSSSSPKNTQQSQRIPTAAATPGNSRGFPRAKHQLLLHQAGQLESEVAREDTPSTADSRASQVQKDSSTQKYAIPAPTQNFTLISPAKASLTSLTSGGSNHSEKLQQPIHNKAMKMDLSQSQALAMSFASFGGAAASSGAAMQGLDFSSMAQNHALFQSLPEAARHNFHISAAAAAAVHAAQQQQQHKKPEVVKSASDLGTASIGGEDGKISSVSNVLGSVHQHSLVLSRAEAEPPISSVHSEIDSSSRNQPSSGAPRISSRPSSTAPASTSTPGLHAPNSHNIQQQQHFQQVLQLQRQHQQFQQQQQLQQQQQRANSGAHNNAGVYTERLPGSSNASKFPQALAGFPSSLMQNSSSSQSPQWKASPRTSSAASSAALSPSASSSVKNQISLQQQVRSQLQPPHQTHISFGVSPAKVAGQAGQHLISSGSINPATGATITVGSPHALVSKNSGGSSLASSAAKSGPPPVLPSLPLQKQQPSKNSSSTTSSSVTPLTTTNRNMPSILGTPHTNSASNSSTKSQSSSSLHQSAKQHLPQAAQFFFSNPYMQNQATPSDAAVSYFQQHSQRPSQLKEKSSSSTGILSLVSASSSTTPCGVSAPPDPSKAAEAAPASNSKGLMPSNRLLQQHAQSVSLPGVTTTMHPLMQQQHAQSVSLPGSTTTTMHPLMPAPAAFPYMHSLQSVSLKPAAASEQKPAAGNDSLHACWQQQQQPEKR